MESDFNAITQQMEYESANISENAIYAFLIVVAISMIFEHFVKEVKEEIRKKKDDGEDVKEARKRMYKILGIHAGVLLLGFIIFAFILKFSSMERWFLVGTSIYVVWISTIRIRFFKRKKQKN